MPRYAVLLRGINVGGNRRVSMPDLRALLEKLGNDDVATYLNSGNVVLTSKTRSADKLGEQLHDALSSELKADAGVVVRTKAQIADTVAKNPYPDAVDTPKLLHVTFLSDADAAAKVAAVPGDTYPPDAFEVIGRDVYIRYAGGSVDTKLSTDLFKKLPGVATDRNWNTVLALHKMLAS